MTPRYEQAFRFTPEQYVAFSWVALEKGDPGAWLKIDPRTLSFTRPGWGPLEQRYGSLDEGFRVLHIIPGSDAGNGFVALRNPDGSVNEEDARRKRNQWVLLLPAPDDDS